MARQTQTINLDMKPQKNPPHIAVTEYDKGADGWFLRLRLFQDGEPFIPDSGTTVKIEGTTPGGTGFSANATLVSNDNMVTFTLTEDMTAYKGSAWCKLILTKSGSVSGASGFWLDCDRAGVEADTVIGAPGFGEQIKDAVASVMDEKGIGIDKTLTVSGSAADAKVTGDKVAELKSATSLHDDEIDNTVQTITFASDGSIQKIEHKRNYANVVIRTDTFTFATNMITEVRMLYTGETLTIATNLTTLETTVTYAVA